MARRCVGAAVGLALVSGVIVLIVLRARVRVFSRVLACSRVYVRVSCLYMSACVRVYARLREARSLRVSQQRGFDILGGDISSGLEVWLLLVICRATEQTSPAKQLSQPLSVWTGLQSGVDKPPQSR